MSDVRSIFQFLMLNFPEFMSAVCVYWLGRGCVCADVWPHPAYRLSQVLHGVITGKNPSALYAEDYTVKSFNLSSDY